MTKYGSAGMYDKHSFKGLNLEKDLGKLLVSAANHSLGVNTWSNYKTVGRLLVKCQQDLKTKFDFPMGTNNTLKFIAWLIERGLKGKSMDCYLSGLRQIHLAKGFDEPSLRPPIVKAVLAGRCHIDTMGERLSKKAKRIPVTPTIMKLLKAGLNEWGGSYTDKRLVWAVCAIAFNGGFRIHELLSRNEKSFDPAFTLLGKDLNVQKVKVGRVTEEILTVRLKSP